MFFTWLFLCWPPMACVSINPKPHSLTLGMNSNIKIVSEAEDVFVLAPYMLAYRFGFCQPGHQFWVLPCQGLWGKHVRSEQPAALSWCVAYLPFSLSSVIAYIPLCPQMCLKYTLLTVLLLLAIFYLTWELHIELTLYYYWWSWIRQEIEPLTPLWGCFKPEQASPVYNVTKQLYGLRITEVQAGMAMCHGLNCWKWVQSQASKHPLEHPCMWACVFICT